jgi:hypothetical protein
MFSISDNEIRITRGDTARMELDIKNSEGEAYEPQEGDVVKFTVKGAPTDLLPLIQKDYTNGGFTIEPADTEKLNFGAYFYDVQITLANGDVCTIIPPTQFIVVEEVTW